MGAVCPRLPVTWWASKKKKKKENTQRVCLHSPTAVALLECAKQVGKLQLRSLIYIFFLFLQGGGEGGGVREVVPACLLLNGIQE